MSTFHECGCAYLARGTRAQRQRRRSPITTGRAPSTIGIVLFIVLMVGVCTFAIFIGLTFADVIYRFH